MGLLLLFDWETLIDQQQQPPLCTPSLVQQEAQTAPPDQTKLLREASLKHKLICALAVSPILNLALSPRLEAGKRPHVCIYK